MAQDVVGGKRQRIAIGLADFPNQHSVFVCELAALRDRAMDQNQESRNPIYIQRRLGRAGAGGLF